MARRLGTMRVQARRPRSDNRGRVLGVVLCDDGRSRVAAAPMVVDETGADEDESVGSSMLYDGKQSRGEVHGGIWLR